MTEFKFFAYTAVIFGRARITCTLTAQLVTGDGLLLFTAYNFTRPNCLLC